MLITRSSIYFTIDGTRFFHKTSFVAKYREQEVYIPQYVLTILSKAACLENRCEDKSGSIKQFCEPLN